MQGAYMIHEDEERGIWTILYRDGYGEIFDLNAEGDPVADRAGVDEWLRCDFDQMGITERERDDLLNVADGIWIEADARLPRLVSRELPEARRVILRAACSHANAPVRHPYQYCPDCGAVRHWPADGEPEPWHLCKLCALPGVEV